MEIRFIVLALSAALNFVSPALAQADASEKVAARQQAKSAKASTLEEALEKALKNNPDIFYAEAKVYEAEAELNRVRQRVTSEVLACQAEYQATLFILNEVKRRLMVLEALREKDNQKVTDSEIGEARVAVAKFHGDIVVK